MTDFETHPVGTADLVKRLREKQICTGFEQVEPEIIDCVYGSDPVCQDAADCIEQLEAELTRSNAATAAAYEVAAKVGFGYGGLSAARSIRALATPDQTAALDKLIAAAVEPYLEALIWCSGSLDFNEGGIARKGWQKLCAPLILAASKKGGV